MARAILRFREVQRRTGFSRSTVCRRVRAGTFPQPVDLGNGLLGFYDDEVDEWVEDRPRVTPSHGRSRAEAVEDEQPDPEDEPPVPETGLKPP